jgi:hypothetical protein
VALHIHVKQKGQDGSEQVAALLDGVKASGDPCVLGVLSKASCCLVMLASSCKLVGAEHQQASVSACGPVSACGLRSCQQRSLDRKLMSSHCIRTAFHQPWSRAVNPGAGGPA